MSRYAFAAALAAAAFVSAPAIARDFLVSSVPAADSTTWRGSQNLTLNFANAIVTTGDECIMTLDAMFETAQHMAPVCRPGSNAKQVIVHLTKPLQPGTYMLEWQLESADTNGHRGQIVFTVPQ
jgi:methionine-rich copper-binding protein CopC